MSHENSKSAKSDKLKVKLQTVEVNHRNSRLQMQKTEIKTTNCRESSKLYPQNQINSNPTTNCKSESSKLQTANADNQNFKL